MTNILHIIVHLKANMCFAEASPQQAIMEAETLPATDSQLDGASNVSFGNERSTPAPASPVSTLPSSASHCADDVTSLALYHPIFQV